MRSFQPANLTVPAESLSISNLDQGSPLLQLASDLIPVGLAALAALTAAWSAAFLTGRLSPNIELSIKPSWTKKRWLRLELEIENAGYIRAKIKKVLFSIREVPRAPGADELSMIGGEFLSFEDAEQIFKSSYYINPKEKIHVERLYHHNSSSFIQAGMQIYLDYPWYIKVLGSNARSTRQTRTYYFSRKIDSDLKLEIS